MDESLENDNNEKNEIGKNTNEITEKNLVISPEIEIHDNNNIPQKEILTESNNIVNTNKEGMSPLLDETDSSNKIKYDHLILVEHSKILKIPYFNFGFTLHFFCPCKKLPQRIKLSEMPTPPFTIGPECKSL